MYPVSEDVNLAYEIAYAIRDLKQKEDKANLIERAGEDYLRAKIALERAHLRLGNILQGSGDRLAPLLVRDPETLEEVLICPKPDPESPGGKRFIVAPLVKNRPEESSPE